MPTLETTVILESGYRGTASVPAGASIGKYEAVELRDRDQKRYNGMGVLKAVDNVVNVIGLKLRGMDSMKQREIDNTLLALDGSPNKQRLGSNSLLSVSLSVSVAAAAQEHMPLFKYINTIFGGSLHTSIERMPTPIFNLINGGLHGGRNLNFQEFHVVPATNISYRDCLRMGEEIYTAARIVLDSRNFSHAVGDEGGYAPNLYANLEALEILIEAIRLTSYKFGVEIFLGLDVAAAQCKTERGYEIKDHPTPMTTNDFIKFLADLHKTYRLLILEDALVEDDWAGWKQLTTLIGSEIHIVGDDFLATNVERLRKAISEHACTAILCKPNQIGTLTEYFEVIRLAKANDIKCIVSHRSGETNDTFIADLAVGLQADYVKFGAPARGERVAKYNRLLAIESELFPESKRFTIN